MRHRCSWGRGTIRLADLTDGQQGEFAADTDVRLSATAVVSPSNTFTLGSTTRNEKKGTASLTVTVPNPGELTGLGKGVKVAGAAGAVSSKKVTAPGKVKLTDQGDGQEEAEAERDRQGQAQAKDHLHPDRRRPQHTLGEGEAEEEAVSP